MAPHHRPVRVDFQNFQRNPCHDPAGISEPPLSASIELAGSRRPATLHGMVYGREIIGTWQQIVVIGHDNRPRPRRVFVQLVGE